MYISLYILFDKNISIHFYIIFHHLQTFHLLSHRSQRAACSCHGHQAEAGHELRWCHDGPQGGAKGDAGGLMLGASDRFQKIRGLVSPPKKTQKRKWHIPPPQKNWRIRTETWKTREKPGTWKKSPKKMRPTQTAQGAHLPICPAGHLPWTFCKPANLEEKWC